MSAKGATFFHRTTRAAVAAILQDGFRDAAGYYLISKLTSGVFLGDVPLDANEGARGDTVLRVAFPQHRIGMFARYEYVERGKPYREWQVPAKFINKHASVTVLTEDEAAEARADIVAKAQARRAARARARAAKQAKK